MFFRLLSVAPVCWTFSTCMADYNSLQTQCPPSLYEQYCCNTDNSGETIKLSENNKIKIIFCPSNLPTSCQKFFTSLNYCSKIFEKNASAVSGYYVIEGSSVYCDLVDYINKLNFSDCHDMYI